MISGLDASWLAGGIFAEVAFSNLWGFAGYLFWCLRPVSCGGPVLVENEACRLDRESKEDVLQCRELLIFRIFSHFVDVVVRFARFWFRIVILQLTNEVLSEGSFIYLSPGTLPLRRMLSFSVSFWNGEASLRFWLFLFPILLILDGCSLVCAKG